MLPQNSRIRRLRVALRAAEWFFISVHVFDVVFISAGFMDLESKSDKSKSEFLSNVIAIWDCVQRTSTRRGGGGVSR